MLGECRNQSNGKNIVERIRGRAKLASKHRITYNVAFRRIMNATVVTVLAFAGILGASMLGMLLKRVLPDAHLTAETKDTVRVAMALVATMTALLLGLLIASAKGSYDTQRGQVILLAGKLG